MIKHNFLQCNFSIFSFSVMLPVCFKHGRGILLYFKHTAGTETSSWQRQSPITDSQTVQAHTCTDIISIVKPTRCTNVSNLFHFWMILYMFWTVFPSIIRSSRLYIQQPDTAVCLLANRLQYPFDKCLLLYVQFWTPDDGQKDYLKHVECHSKIK